MTRYALRFRDGTIQVRRVADDVEIARFQARGDRDIWVFSFSPDGRYLATTHQPENALTVWDIDRGTVAVNDPAGCSWQPNSARTAAGSSWAMLDGEFLVYDLPTGQPVRRWRGPRRCTIWPSAGTGPRSRSPLG